MTARTRLENTVGELDVEVDATGCCGEGQLPNQHSEPHSGRLATGPCIPRAKEAGPPQAGDQAAVGRLPTNTVAQRKRVRLITLNGRNLKDRGSKPRGVILVRRDSVLVALTGLRGTYTNHQDDPVG